MCWKQKLSLMLTLLFIVLPALSIGAAELPPVNPGPVLPFEVTSRAAVLMDAASGQIVYGKNAAERLDPASLTKIMTVYLAFEALQSGKVTLADQVTVSEEAWRIGGSTMYIEVGRQVSFDDLLKGITVASGNDATLSVAETIAGTVGSFVATMNQRAVDLGLNNTQFRNTHGLTEEGHYMSAGDVATLSRRHIIQHPEALAYHSQREFQYNNILQANRNGLLGKYPGCDGLKTGQTSQAGYCLVATAQREGMRLIAVIMGAEDAANREKEATSLLDYGFQNYATVFLADRATSLQELRIWKGSQTTVPVGTAESIYQTVPKGKEALVTTELQLDKTVAAPVEQGQKLGEMVVFVEGQEMRRVDLVAQAAVPRGGIFRRFADSVSYFFARVFRRI
jgi:serine-type D-Ala-D-Ala carboxypeptidase (penicillin-binding protein 5/6)